MFSRMLLSLLGMSIITGTFCRPDPGWVRLSLTGPSGLTDNDGFLYYVNDVLVGTPPATESLALSIDISTLAVSSSDCVFCPGAVSFDPKLSSTYETLKQFGTMNRTANSTDLSILLSQETVSFGSVLTSLGVPFGLIERMSQKYQMRMLNGYFGLWVDPINEIARRQHVFSRLHSSGQLLNPVIGVLIGRTPETSRMTIGALDPNDFEGTINWIQAETPDPSWDSPLAIKLDGFTGFNGSLLPYPSPFLAYFSTINKQILVPNDRMYFEVDGYSGPGSLGLSPEFNQYELRCNGTGAYVHFSVVINGVSYQIDSQGNLLRPNSIFETEGYCAVGIRNFTTSAAVPSLLGLPFFRSVYLTYRFPTDDCPNAYYGFAFQKGANRTSSMLAQQPRSTPTGAGAQCLSLTTPTSTPTISTRPPQASAFAGGSYTIWGHPETQVKLNGVQELPAGIVKP